MLDINHIRTLASEVAGIWNGVFSAGASDDELQRFTANTGVALPNTLRSWLKVTNGVFMEPGSWSGLDEIRLEYKAFPEWRDRGWIPCAKDQFGNTWAIIRDKATGLQPVVFFDLSDWDRPQEAVASSFDVFLLEMLQFLAARGSWIWYGDRKEVERRDPDFFKLKGYGLSWET